jgi:hypothetical protein
MMRLTGTAAEANELLCSVAPAVGATTVPSLLQESTATRKGGKGIAETCSSGLPMAASRDGLWATFARLLGCTAKPGRGRTGAHCRTKWEALKVFTTSPTTERGDAAPAGMCSCSVGCVKRLL